MLHVKLPAYSRGLLAEWPTEISTRTLRDASQGKGGISCFLGKCIVNMNILNDETKVTDRDYLLI